MGWHDAEADYVLASEKGLSEEIAREISLIRHEPEWMLQFRLEAYNRSLAEQMKDVGRR